MSLPVVRVYCETWMLHNGRCSRINADEANT